MSKTGSIIKTKTFWGGVAMIMTGVGLVVTGDVPEGVQTIGAGIVAIFMRQAIGKS
jgi:hypothetical protein